MRRETLAEKVEILKETIDEIFGTGEFPIDDPFDEPEEDEEEEARERREAEEKERRKEQERRLSELWRREKKRQERNAWFICVLGYVVTAAVAVGAYILFRFIAHLLTGA